MTRPCVELNRAVLLVFDQTIATSSESFGTADCGKDRSARWPIPVRRPPGIKSTLGRAARTAISARSGVSVGFLPPYRTLRGQSVHLGTDFYPPTREGGKKHTKTRRHACPDSRGWNSRPTNE